MSTQTFNHFSSRRQRRKGLSLLEVILAIGIMGMAMAIISNMVGLGVRAAGATKWRSQAQILCDTIMAELAASAIPLESISEAVVTDRPEWSYSIQVAASELTGLLKVDVIVQPSDRQATDLDPFQLTRLVPDPDYEPEQGLVQ